MSLRLLALAGLLVACNPEEPEAPKPPAPDCVDWFPDQDGDGFGDQAATPLPVCDDSSSPSGHVDNGDDCDDANPEIRPGVPEQCDLLGIDENCNGLIDADDPEVVGTVDTYPDNDGDGHGVEGAIEQACLSSPGRSRTTDDCDDADPTVSPSAGFYEPELKEGCYQDADGDGHGVMEPTNPVAEPGTDCDDTDGGRYPTATEIFGDGFDQDCNDEDLWALVDDFEDGAVDPAIWATASGDYTYATTSARSGTTSLRFGSYGGNFQTIELDTTTCAGGTGLTWSVFVKRDGAPDDGENLRIEYYDGSAWIVLQRILGGGITDSSFIEYAGVLDDPKVFGPGTKFRVGYLGASLTSEIFFVDDFSVMCAGPDGDGDGLGERGDCDDTDASHWSDCGACIDADGDDYGNWCDLGEDCDDGDASVVPGASDLLVDGVDNDCNGVDGPGVSDDFESGVIGPMWASITGDAGYDSTYFHAGSYSLNLGGGGGTAESVTMDTSTCASVLWSYFGKRGPETPDASEDLVFSWWNGVAWVEADRQAGAGVTDSVFTQRMGTITDPLALSSSFRIRFTSNGTAVGNDDHFVDDLVVGCGLGDGDGDGVDDGLDCDDTDPAHWNDCSTCQDLDGDDYGLDCNTGPDCDDAVDTVHPGAADPVGDGIDSDCSGTDGVGFLDDFESGVIGPMWASITGDAGYDSTYFHAGSYSLNLGGGGGTAESVTLDTSVCASVLWSYFGKRGPETPDAGEDLVLSWWDGAAWVEADRQAGAGVTDNTFTERSGTITDPLALSPGFRIRFTSNGTAVGNDDHFVDDLVVGCGAPDGDGDGFVSTDDCDDTDAAHWDDCGLCVDGDGDGYGLDCNLGGDCDDASITIHPGAGDTLGDGIDSDCSGFDGAGLVDDFETGAVNPIVWASATGDYSYSTTFARSGTYSVRFGSGGATFESVGLDTSSCAGTSVLWSLFVKRDGGPDNGEDLRFERYDGSSWVIEQEILGGGATDTDFVEYGGQITDPAAFGPGTRFRIVSTGATLSTEIYYVDDLTVACAGGDGDGDGVDAAFDCDDGDPNHWSDCALCQDLDGDGFGLDCDLGPDCDDLEPLVHPGAGDTFGDGLDTDCSGLDGDDLYDDFEGGVVDAGVWASATGDYTYSTTFANSGTTSVHIGGGGATFESVDVDTSACSSVLWGLFVKRDGDPDNGDNLRIERFDGVSWVLLHEILGGGQSDAMFVEYGGTLTDPTAFGPGRRIRIVGTGSSLATETYFVDDLLFGCGLGDGDGDGVDGAIDCDDTDPAHWSDCGLCVDGDIDGYGLDCDLGDDCDDFDSATFPGAPDPFGDGIDSDCTGVDGPGFVDDFELGAPASWWASMTGDYAFSTAYFASGTTSLNMAGASAVAETIPLDMSACTAIDWAYMVKRGPENPDAGDDLELSYETATGWVVFDSLTGNGTADPSFLLHAGTIVDPAAFWSGFRVRLESNGAASSDDYFIDDLEIICL